jgi:hypothetical protein
MPRANWITRKSGFIFPARGNQRRVGLRRSQADKGLDQLAEETIETKLSRHGDQANAFFVAADERLVIDVIIAKVEVASCEKSSSMGEAPGQNTRHFKTGMGVL